MTKKQKAGLWVFVAAVLLCTLCSGLTGSYAGGYYRSFTASNGLTVVEISQEPQQADDEAGGEVAADLLEKELAAKTNEVSLPRGVRSHCKIHL